MQETQTRQMPSCMHDFRCVTTRGAFQEVQIGTSLPPRMLEQVREDPSQEQRVCPHGAIQCVKCSSPLLQGTERMLSEVPTAGVLLANLRRIPEKGTPTQK